MEQLDYIIILLYFLGPITVSVVMSRKTRNSEDMFIAGRNPSWWLLGVSPYMTIFSASTLVVWGDVVHKSGLVAVAVIPCFGVASLIVGKWISGKWRELRIKSPGEFPTIRFGYRTVSFYTISGIVTRAVHMATSSYTVAVVMCASIKVDGGSIFASTGMMGDSSMGYLNVRRALLTLGAIVLRYAIAGGFLAVLTTNVIQFGVFLAVVVFMTPLSFNAVGGVSAFIDKANEIPGFFSGISPTCTWGWLLLWILLNVSVIGGDWSPVQRYISVSTTRDAKKSTYSIGILYLVAPLIWYLPTTIYRVMEPGFALDLDATTTTFNGEHAYANINKLALMKGMVDMMLAAMLSATLSNVSGILNVYANVYTCDIWGHKEKNRQADEKERIKVGRLFTLVFRLVIIALSMFIPFAGGAEKVVVALLTMVMYLLYIPSIWGLFSKWLTDNQLISAMTLTWLVGIMARVIIPAPVTSSSLIESVIGRVLPVPILAIMEVWSACKKYKDNGYQTIGEHTDPETDREPTLKEKKAVLIYSHLAVNCFCITVGVVAFLLIGLSIAGDSKIPAVKGIVIEGVVLMIAMIFAYVIYRIIYVGCLKMSS